MTNRGKSILSKGKMDVNTVSGIMQAEAVNQDAQSSFLSTGVKAVCLIVIILSLVIIINLTTIMCWETFILG